MVYQAAAVWAQWWPYRTLHRIESQTYIYALAIKPKPSYRSLIRSISWLMMTWRRKEPCHQQQWNWLLVCEIGKSCFSMRRDFNCLCHISVEEWNELSIYFMFFQKILTCKGLMQQGISGGYNHYEMNWNWRLICHWQLISKIRGCFTTLWWAPMRL